MYLPELWSDVDLRFKKNNGSDSGLDSVRDKYEDDIFSWFSETLFSVSVTHLSVAAYGQTSSPSPP